MSREAQSGPSFEPARIQQDGHSDRSCRYRSFFPRGRFKPASSADQTLPSEVQFIALSDGKDWRVSDGYAIDWIKPPCPGTIRQSP